MAATQKTTVYLDADAYRRLKTLARRRGVPPAQLVREAVSSFTEQHTRRRVPPSVGAGASGTRDLGTRADTWLAKGFGRTPR